MCIGLVFLRNIDQAFIIPCILIFRIDVDRLSDIGYPSGLITNENVWLGTNHQASLFYLYKKTNEEDCIDRDSASLL